MKILLINNSHIIHGGADRVYMNTGKLLIEKNHDVLYFGTVNEPKVQIKEDGDIFVSNNIRHLNFFRKLLSFRSYLYNFNVAKRLNKLIINSKPDIAHIHLFYGTLTSSILLVLKKNNIPTVMTIHDYRLLCPANAFLDKNSLICEKCKYTRYYNCFLKRCSAGNILFSTVLMLEAYLRQFFIKPKYYINHFIFVSKFSKDKHVTFKEYFKNKSSLLHNFTKSIPTVKSTKGDYFLYFGRLSREKGLVSLIDSVIELNLKLIIAGGGPLENYISKISTKHENIQYVGHKSEDELSKYIYECLFVVVPSEWYENNPMSIIESYAHKKPVIGSNIGGIPEIIIENVTGYLYKPKSQQQLNKVLTLAESICQFDYDVLCKNAEHFYLKMFSEDNHYMNLMEIYNKVINERNSTKNN